MEQQIISVLDTIVAFFVIEVAEFVELIFPMLKILFVLGIAVIVLTSPYYLYQMLKIKRRAKE